MSRTRSSRLRSHRPTLVLMSVVPLQALSEYSIHELEQLLEKLTLGQPCGRRSHCRGERSLDAAFLSARTQLGLNWQAIGASARRAQQGLRSAIGYLPRTPPGPHPE